MQQDKKRYPHHMLCATCSAILRGSLLPLCATTSPRRLKMVNVSDSLGLMANRELVVVGGAGVCEGAKSGDGRYASGKL